MTEKIVSPGVFTREKDLSYITEGISAIGGAIIGPFRKGPAFIPTIVETQSEFERIFGTPDGTFYTDYCVQDYLRESGICTVVRVLGVDGYTQQQAIILRASGSAGDKIVGALFNSAYPGNSPLTGFSASAVTQSGTTTNFVIESGSEWSYSCSLSTGSADYIENVFGTDSRGGQRPAYVSHVWKETLGSTFQGTGSVITLDETIDQAFAQDAKVATTPWITSQLIADQRYNLFRFHTHGHGNAANTEVKVCIEQVKKAGTIAGSDYGIFNVIVREYADSDTSQNVLETFYNCSMDPASVNYLPRMVGDRYTTIDSDGRLTEHGDWSNYSNYIRVEMANVSEYPKAAVPASIREYYLPILCTNDDLVPRIQFITTSVSDTTKYSGWDFSNIDNTPYVNPVPDNATTGSNGIFCLDSSGSAETNAVEYALDLTLTTSTEIAKRKFAIAFQSGFDGMALNVSRSLGSNITAGNTQGFDCTDSTASGSVAYVKAINAISNQDEFDINLVAMPGIIRRLHSSVVTSAIDMVETRGDCFYIADFNALNDSLTQAIVQSDAVDSSYCAHYYPWIKIVDTNTNQLVSVPPSVVLPAIYSANDNIAAEWYAPAGLNRGGITEAVKVIKRLTHAERDDLYEARVNPIAAFPGQGISVWGQKTCQQRPSALDRVNVRRLLIALKKFIASTSRYLIFEQNSEETRAKFINVVTPYLESVQQRQGLYSFRVVMDETNNTPDIIDRNILYGQIYIQPTRAAEFIIVDFNIMPTGASFTN